MGEVDGAGGEGGGRGGEGHRPGIDPTDDITAWCMKEGEARMFSATISPITITITLIPPPFYNNYNNK